MEDIRLDSFERAFSNRSGYARVVCYCGKEFYDDHNGVDWEKGELEKLQADPNAFPCDYAPGGLAIEGRTYVNACDCWHPLAEKLMNWIDCHGRKIAEYLNLEKARLKKEAEHAPEVNP